jgi:hypothetical protein
VWEATVDGRPLHFHLAGINNQNFIMRDEETGSWWQQVSGEAIQGPLKGKKLKPVDHDELTFVLWKREKPAGRVLKPDEKIATAGGYVPADWEATVGKMRVTTMQQLDSSLPPRTIVIGIAIGNAAKAYPFEALQKQSPIIDTLGGVPFIIVLGEDKKSVRAFETVNDGRKLDLYLKPTSPQLRLIDAGSGSEWDFTGKAVSGPLQGTQLKRVSVLTDYWFDWKTYNPSSTVYELGAR